MESTWKIIRDFPDFGCVTCFREGLTFPGNLSFPAGPVEIKESEADIRVRDCIRRDGANQVASGDNRPVFEFVADTVRNYAAAPQ